MEWSPGVLKREDFERRRNKCTAEQLNQLLASKEYQAWQQRKLRNIIRWDLVSGASFSVWLLCTCLLLFLRPPPGPGSPAMQHPYSLQPATFSNHSSRLWHAPLEVPLELRREQQLLQRQLGIFKGELGRVKLDLEAALDLASDLSLQLQTAQKPVQLPPPAATLMVPEGVFGVCAKSGMPAQKPDPPAWYNNSTIDQLDYLFSTWEDKPAVPQIPTEEHSSVEIHAPVLAAVLGMAVLALAAYVTAQATTRHLRGRAEELEKQLQATAAQLEDTAFAKENAEQSVTMLEQELVRKVEQVETMQRKTLSASPLSVTSDTSSPFTPMTRYTPGRGELPPPPAALVEQFLKERNAVAVEEQQVQEWILMEDECRRLAAQLAALSEQRCQMQATQQKLLLDQSHDGHLKEWLDVAQEELLTTQSQLQERETECHTLAAQLAAAHQKMSLMESKGMQEKEQSLLEQNMVLVQQLQTVTAAFEALQAQFSSTQMELATKQAESRKAAVELQSALQEVAESAPMNSQTEAEMGSEVESMIELMRATRMSLSQRLNRSQEVCAQTISGLTKLAKRDEDDTLRRAAGLQSPPPTARLSHKGSPAPSENTPLREARSGSTNRQNSTPVPTNFSFTTLPAKRATPNKENPTPAGRKHEGSLRKTREAAKQHVLSLRAQYSAWELGEFLHRLGCEKPFHTVTTPAEFAAIKEQGVVALAEKAASGKTANDRAVAGEALAVLRHWEFPAKSVKVAPPSPAWFARLGLGRD